MQYVCGTTGTVYSEYKSNVIVLEYDIRVLLSTVNEKLMLGREKS